MEEKISCKKYILPNGKTVDILTDVFEEINKWIQYGEDKEESGGYIFGYQHKITGNMTLERVTHPFETDIRTRYYFKLQDENHYNALKFEEADKSYYMGVWHSHPQDEPVPSTIDWSDWKDSLEKEKSGGAYIFFIIAGRKRIRIWVGSKDNHNIEEIFECDKIDDIYVIGGDDGQKKG